MAQTFDFYNARAEEADVSAQNATLDNVRERSLRSAQVWRSLANQAKEVERERAKAAQIRAERKAQEAADAAAAAELEATEQEQEAKASLSVQDA